MKQNSRIYSRIGLPISWLILAWFWIFVLTFPAILCMHFGTRPNFGVFCNSLGWLGYFGSLFGPTLLMPLFLVLILTRRLGKIFYPKETILIAATMISLLLAALLSAVLFVVPVSTLDVPYVITHAIQNVTLKNIAQMVVYALWLVPAGMLYMLALFMIQFGLLKDTLKQGYKPILMYIISGGLTALTFGFFATLLGIYVMPYFTNVFPIKFSAVNNPIVQVVSNPYFSLILDLITPLPMLILLKKTLTDKIMLPKK